MHIVSACANDSHYLLLLVLAAFIFTFGRPWLLHFIKKSSATTASHGVAR
jgi:hypothetical protein